MTKAFRIDNQTITSKDLLPLLHKYRLIPQLAREVITDQAIAEIECSLEEQALVRQQFLEQRQLKKDSHLSAWLQQQNMTEQQLEYQLERQLKLEKFKQATWGQKLEAYFLARKSQLDRVVYSLIRIQEAGVAQELYFRLQEKESSFTELAQHYSQGPEAQTGGIFGPVELGSLHPKIFQMLHSGQPGKLWFPIRVENWWVIIRLEKFINAQLNESMRQRLLDEQFQNWLLKQLQQKVSDIDKSFHR